MKLLCLHQQKFWTHLVIREASICWYIRNERGTVVSDTRGHKGTPCSTRLHKRAADPICSPLHSEGFVYLMQNQYLYFQDNDSNILMEQLPNFKVKFRCSLQKNLITAHKRRSCLSHKHVAIACGNKLADGYRFVRPTIHCTSGSANIEFTQNCLSRHFFT